MTNTIDTFTIPRFEGEVQTLLVVLIIIMMIILSTCGHDAVHASEGDGACVGCGPRGDELGAERDDGRRRVGEHRQHRPVGRAEGADNERGLRGGLAVADDEGDALAGLAQARALDVEELVLVVAALLGGILADAAGLAEDSVEAIRQIDAGEGVVDGCRRRRGAVVPMVLRDGNDGPMPSIALGDGENHGRRVLLRRRRLDDDDLLDLSRQITSGGQHGRWRQWLCTAICVVII